jgi:hypothetical protein
MSQIIEKPPKLGNEITVRISLTFQEAPDIHTLLAMTPVRERGKLVRLALERYIKETEHPAGNVEQQISAISAWLRSRGAGDTARVEVVQPLFGSVAQHVAQPTANENTLQPSSQSLESTLISTDGSPSISRWLQT